ncbi:MAG: isoaspartyl peptidase/L-asparaginase [Flavobacteriaceae bacterium]|nr:isoaspartyl peptidase/L-asparaginase [Flavobacteriaceae bacterium]MBT6170327.1 isoaspartyl peptidase/L-asparaginase [Flavobacteriaceae bacterium]|tara:strand:- start:158 stop:1168 length:1011 start_codon:yes stop_codon:yes gene_type:complete
MKKILLITIFLFTSCLNNEKEKKDINFGIVIHGGAGTLLKENMSDEKEKQYLIALETAIKIGYNIIKDGGSSQLAVEKTINFLENSPLFNAGKGAVLTSSGTVELDASFMDGKTLNAGAVAGVRTLKNPISAAIKVMDNSPHVFLSGEGADQFGKEQGLDIVDQKYFLTKRRINSLKNVKEKESNNKISFINSTEYLNQKYGTVGCVVLDKNGNLASGTSTGGMTNKKWNRIGDVPVIGAGTYANNATCAVSSTGWGEFFIRNVVAYDISALIEYKGLSVKEAARIVIHDKVAKLGGNGGVIAIDNKGNVAMEMNTPGMYRAHINSQGELNVKIFN